MVCQALGFADGMLYTFGSSASLPDLPIVAGFRVCDGTEASIFDCAEHGNALSDEACAAAGLPSGCMSPEDRDCASAGSECRTLSPAMCPTHAIDQGAICVSTENHGSLKCQTHNGNGDDTCDDWHHCSGGCQTCGGCGFGCSQVVEHPQDVIFGCVEFASVMCLISVASADAITYQAALQAFGTCASGGGDTEGYCRGSLASAAYLRNQDVCENGANSNIAFHIRIPFRVNGEFP